MSSTSKLPVAILAGGKGTRFGETTQEVPKPMVSVGDRPILWHIVRGFAEQGFGNFLIAGGHLIKVIREFADNDEFNIPSKQTDSSPIPRVSVRVIDTGAETNTGGRVGRLRSLIGERRFLLTWGDGLSDIDLHRLISFHESHGRWVTVTAVHPPARFGRLTLESNRVVGFEEKPRDEAGWINGAFFVVEPEVFDLIEGDESSWERDVMLRLTELDQLRAFRHAGFWQCMDNAADRQLLQNYWESGNLPWVWKDST